MSNASYASIESGSQGKVGEASFTFSAAGVDVNKPRRILFVKRLIEITTEILPNLWRLGQAYFNRTLFTVRILILILL